MVNKVYLKKLKNQKKRIFKNVPGNTITLNGNDKRGTGLTIKGLKTYIATNHRSGLQKFNHLMKDLNHAEQDYAGILTGYNAKYANRAPRVKQKDYEGSGRRVWKKMGVSGQIQSIKEARAAGRREGGARLKDYQFVSREEAGDGYVPGLRRRDLNRKADETESEEEQIVSTKTKRKSRAVTPSGISLRSGRPLGM